MATQQPNKNRPEYGKSKITTNKSNTKQTIRTEEQWNQVNPSCLLAYLGIRGFANIEGANLKKRIQKRITNTCILRHL